MCDPAVGLARSIWIPRLYPQWSHCYGFHTTFRTKVELVLTPLLTSLVLLANAGGTVGGLPSKAPAAVGMSAARLQKIDKVLARGIKAGGFPGGVVVIGRRGATVLDEGFGNLS